MVTQIGGVGINYDDFYKFLVSAGTIFAIFFIYLASQILQIEGVNILFGIYFVSILCTFFGIGFGLTKWYERQSLLDRDLKLEIRKKEIEVKNSEQTYYEKTQNVELRQVLIDFIKSSYNTKFQTASPSKNENTI